MKTFLERMRGNVEKTAKFQPMPGTKETFNDKDKVDDLLDESIWQDPKREVAFRWIETQYGLRLAFKLRGMHHIEYVSFSRQAAKEPVANPAVQLFQLTRDTQRNGLTMKAGCFLMLIIGPGNTAELTEAIDAEEPENVLDKMRRKRIEKNGVDA